MEKKTLYLKTKWVVVNNENKTANLIYRIEKTKPVNMKITLDDKETFNSPKNRETILNAFKKENIVITDLNPRRVNNKEVLAGMGMKILTLKKYKTKNYKPKSESGFSFLETAIVAAIIVTLGAFMAPNLINLANTAKETHIAAVENENTNMDVYNSMLGVD